jgi:hypothetical protein
MHRSSLLGRYAAERLGRYIIRHPQLALPARLMVLRDACQMARRALPVRKMNRLCDFTVEPVTILLRMLTLITQPRFRGEQSIDDTFDVVSCRVPARVEHQIWELLWPSDTTLLGCCPRRRARTGPRYRDEQSYSRMVAGERPASAHKTRVATYCKIFNQLMNFANLLSI